MFSSKVIELASFKLIFILRLSCETHNNQSIHINRENTTALSLNRCQSRPQTTRTDGARLAYGLGLESREALLVY